MTTPQSAGPVARRVADLGAALDRFWVRLVDLSGPLLFLGLAVLAIVRSGVHHAEYEIGAWLHLTEAFPDPLADWRANSVLGPALGSLVGVTEQWQWVLLHGVVIAAVAGLTAWCLVERFPDRVGRRVAAVWLAVGAVPTVLLQKVGSYDPYTVAGCLLVVLGGRTGTAVVGGVLIGLTSAEQGAIGLMGAAVLVVILASDDTDRENDADAAGTGGTGTAAGGGLLGRLRRAPAGELLLVGLAALVVARVLLLASFSVRGGSVPSRTSVLGELLGDSLRNVATSGGVGVYAWFGLGWLVLALVWLVGHWDGRTMAAIVAVLVAGPVVATALTLDGTRVFVMVALPAFLVLLAWLADRVSRLDAADTAIVTRITVAALLVSPIVPALVTEPAGNPWFGFPWLI